MFSGKGFLPQNGAQMSLRLAAVLAVLGAVAVLVLGADSSETTSDTRRLFGIWRLRYVVLTIAFLVAGTGLFLAAQSRELVLGFAISIASVFITIGLLEFAGAIGVVSWSALFDRTNGDLGGLGTKPVPNLDVQGKTRQDIALAWKLPNKELPFHYKTDRHGFRNSTDRQAADVILLGDSILVSALVPAEKLVSTVLDGKLTASVMQVALIGLGPQEQHELLWNSKINLQDKLIIQFIFEGNDLLDSRRYRQAQSQATVETERNLLVDQIWNVLTSMTDHGARANNDILCRIGSQQYAFLWTHRSFAGYEDEVPRVTDAMREFAVEAQRRGAKYAVVFVPTKLRVLGELCAFPSDSERPDYQRHLSPFHAHLHEWSTKTGVPMLDLTDALKKMAKAGQIPWFWGDTHWNEFGHAVAAKEIVNWKLMKHEVEKKE